MRRLLALLLVATGAAALLARRRRAQPAAAPAPAPMPGPTAAPRAACRAGRGRARPDRRGRAGAITAAPVPDAEPAARSETVEPPDDATLVQEVESTIAEDPAVPEDGVKVEVENGVAELTGAVPDETAAQRAGDDAAHVDGVIGIDNKLEPGAEEPAPRGGLQARRRRGAVGRRAGLRSSQLRGQVAAAVGVEQLDLDVSSASSTSPPAVRLLTARRGARRLLAAAVRRAGPPCRRPRRARASSADWTSSRLDVEVDVELGAHRLDDVDLGRELHAVRAGSSSTAASSKCSGRMPTITSRLAASGALQR